MNRRRFTWHAEHEDEWARGFVSMMQSRSGAMHVTKIGALRALPKIDRSPTATLRLAARHKLTGSQRAVLLVVLRTRRSRVGQRSGFAGISVKY